MHGAAILATVGEGLKERENKSAHNARKAELWAPPPYAMSSQTPVRSDRSAPRDLSVSDHVATPWFYPQSSGVIRP